MLLGSVRYTRTPPPTPPRKRGEAYDVPQLRRQKYVRAASPFAQRLRQEKELCCYAAMYPYK